MSFLDRQRLLATVILLSTISIAGKAQEGLTKYEQVYRLPDRFFNAISNKSEKSQKGVLKASEKQLQRLSKQEKKLYRQLAKQDSALSKQLQIESDTFYANINAKLRNGNLLSESANVYNGRIDSMSYDVP